MKDASINSGDWVSFTLWQPHLVKLNRTTPSDSYHYFHQYDFTADAWVPLRNPQWTLRIAALPDVKDQGGTNIALTPKQIRDYLRAFRALAKFDFEDTDAASYVVKMSGYDELQVEPPSRFAPAGSWIVSVLLDSDT